MSYILYTYLDVTLKVIAETDHRPDAPRFKDSPTPDRESLHIEETTDPRANTLTKTSSHTGKFSICSLIQKLDLTGEYQIEIIPTVSYYRRILF